jgi:hypothetical protein
MGKVTFHVTGKHIMVEKTSSSPRDKYSFTHDDISNGLVINNSNEY